MSKDNGGSAFPMQPAPHPGGEYQWADYGMSLRDWFAGMALQGIVASYDVELIKAGKEIYGLSPEKSVSQLAYAISDCMISERNKS